MPATNMVFAHLDGRAPISDVQVKNRLAERGVKIGVVGEGRFRMVTHYWIDDDAVAYTVQAFHEVMNKSMVG